MLKLIENPPTVIFSTAFDEYALKAIETHAIDYLLKTFRRERFEIAKNIQIVRQKIPMPTIFKIY